MSGVKLTGLEAWWLVCKEPRSLLSFLTRNSMSPPSERKFRLIACALYRQVWKRLTRTQKRTCIQTEDYLEGECVPLNPPTFDKHRADLQMTHLISLSERRGLAPEKQVDTIRSIIGNPFQTLVVDKSWLTTTVLDIANAAYNERSSGGSLDLGKLGLLSDALEEAGCSDYRILDALREQPQNIYTGDGNFYLDEPIRYRGFWPLDLIMGKT